MPTSSETRTRYARQNVDLQRANFLEQINQGLTERDALDATLVWVNEQAGAAQLYINRVGHHTNEVSRETVRRHIDGYIGGNKRELPSLFTAKEPKLPREKSNGYLSSRAILQALVRALYNSGNGTLQAAIMDQTDLAKIVDDELI